ncbi:MAG: hypothetical protein ABI835_09800, partial [Chloroflexota bacterium]
MIPPVPQTGRQPVSLTPEQIQQTLRRQHTLDQRDPFATDQNADVRTLGRLMLRRSDVNDLFALGDMCVRLSLLEDGRLLVFYVGKTLIAYRRARSDSANNMDRDRAQRATEEYLHWLIEVVRVYSSRRNVAVALWALAEEENSTSDRLVEELLDLYRGVAQVDENSRVDDLTRAVGDSGIFQSETAVTEFQALERTPDSEEQELLSETRIELHLPSVKSEVMAQEAPAYEAATSATLAPEPARGTDDEFSIGDRIEGRYEVADVRRGGMGVVYLCYDHEQREAVALKSFQSRFLENERAVARFVQEALTWIRLEKHRYIVQARLVQ